MICKHCKQHLIPDASLSGRTLWRTASGDYGCDDSPETSQSAVAPHCPVSTATPTEVQSLLVDLIATIQSYRTSGRLPPYSKFLSLQEKALDLLEKQT